MNRRFLAASASLLALAACSPAQQTTINGGVATAASPLPTPAPLDPVVTQGPTP